MTNQGTGSSCATTGSRTTSSNPTTISSTIAARLGTGSSINPGASCPSVCANGHTGSDQWDSVLDGGTYPRPSLRSIVRYIDIGVISGAICVCDNSEDAF